MAQEAGSSNLLSHPKNIMRKRLKKKKRSCAMCKPHKMKWANRWKKKEMVQLEEFEKNYR